MKYLSLFSGIGGFELGIQQAYDNFSRFIGEEKEPEREGVERQRDELHAKHRGAPGCIGFSEIDKYAIQIYEKHFPDHKNYGDITKISPKDIADHDLLVGGFPCQAFSIAGKRGGFKDTRGTLFFEICKIIREKQPRLLLLENVKGLLSHDKGATFYTIISTLDELGYDLQWQVLNSKNHGVPQNRERVFIIGHLRGTSRPQVFPFGGDAEPFKQEIGKDIANTVTDGYLMTGKRPRHKGKAVLLPVGVRRIRRLTPTECERLQGFPDGWTEGVSDTQRYKCLGNAVTVNVIQDIMEKLLITN